MTRNEIRAQRIKEHKVMIEMRSRILLGLMENKTVNPEDKLSLVEQQLTELAQKERLEGYRLGLQEVYQRKALSS